MFLKNNIFIKTYVALRLSRRFLSRERYYKCAHRMHTDPFTPNQFEFFVHGYGIRVERAKNINKSARVPSGNPENMLTLTVPPMLERVGDPVSLRGIIA